MWISSEIRKQKVTASLLITKIYQTRVIYMQRCSPTNLMPGNIQDTPSQFKTVAIGGSILCFILWYNIKMVGQLGSRNWRMCAFEGKQSGSIDTCGSFNKGFLSNLANDNTVHWKIIAALQLSNLGYDKWHAVWISLQLEEMRFKITLDICLLFQ